MSFTIKENSYEGTELLFRSPLDAQVLANAICRALGERPSFHTYELSVPRWSYYDKAKIPVVGFVGNLDAATSAPNVDVLTWPILTKVS